MGATEPRETCYRGREGGGGGGSAGRVTGFSVLSIFFHANAIHMHV